MGTRSIPLTPASGAPVRARTSMAQPAGLILGAITALLGVQTGSLALSLTLMLLPAPILLLFRDWRAIAGHSGIWLTLIALNLLWPDVPRALHLPAEAGHTVMHGTLTHLGVLVLFVSLMHGVSRLLQREFAGGNEATALLERLAPSRLVDLTQRPAAQPDGQLSPAARAFNGHADHLVRMMSAFQMLRQDMKELAVIASRLRQKAAVQKERSDMGADQVSRLYENNDKLSNRAEAIAQTARGTWDTAERILETARQYEEDIRSLRERVQAGRDNIDRLFNQLVQVKAAMNAASTIADKICAIGTSSTADAAARAQVENLSTEITRQFRHMESTIEELTTAIYNSTQVMTLFQEKVEMSFGMTRQITRSTQALQEENASTAGAVEDLVVQMHNSQRQAMDLLSSLEFARNASQEAIAVIENSAQHIVRSEALVEEIDREMLRLKS